MGSNESHGFLELAAKRYSVRKFLDRPVRQEDIDRILAAGHLAPTACNRQPQRILVINSKEGALKLRKCTECHFGAPAALLVCYDRDDCWQRKYDGIKSGEIDASIVATHMMLQAACLGVGMTWVMYFLPEAFKEEFGIPEHIEPVALLLMGYPAEDARPAPGHSEFKPMSELVFYGGF